MTVPSPEHTADAAGSDDAARPDDVAPLEDVVQIRRSMPQASVERLPGYLRVLTELSSHGVTSASSQQLAELAGVGPAQLRKDLSHLGSHGRRGVGYDVDTLRERVQTALGLVVELPVAIVGAGNLGHALANYSGFGALRTGRRGTLGTGRRHPVARGARLPSGSGLDRRDVERDLDLVADEHAAGLEGDVPGQAELLAGDDGVG